MTEHAKGPQPGEIFELNNREFEIHEGPGELVTAHKIPVPSDFFTVDIMILLEPSDEQPAEDSGPEGPTDPIPFRRLGLPDFLNGLN